MIRADHPSRRVVVIGGGIAGLAAAYRLARETAGIQVTLLERDGRLGGKIVTEQVDGFVIEGGPDSFLVGKPRGVGLARDLGLDSRLIGTIVENRRTFVRSGGRLHDLPEGLTGLVPIRLKPLAHSSLLSPYGKARLALDYLLPAKRGDDDESLATFVSRRLGREVYERLVEPLMAGIYAGDGRALSLAATFPQLRRAEREYGGLIKGVLAIRTASKREPSMTATPFVSFPDGLGELVAAMSKELAAAGVNIVLNCRAAQIRRGAGTRSEIVTTHGERIAADGVVLATPAGATADLLDSVAAEASASLRAIPHVSTATVSFAYRLTDLTTDLRGYGYVIPRIEARQALACTWVSAKWPGRAPDGYALIRVFIGRAGQDSVVERDDRDLVAIAREELSDTLGIAATPTLCRVVRWPDGMPQYTLGHLDRVATIEGAVAALPGLAVAGHAYRGVGIPDCIASGEAAAERILSLTGC